MSIDRLAVLKAYVGTRQAHAQLRTRADIERRQARLWRKLTPVIAETPALKTLAGQPLHAFPIVTPSQLRAEFESWNTLGLKQHEAIAAADAAERGESGEVAPGVTAGFSTGTSGSRGLFLASRKERARYLGQALAKLLPGDALFRRRRIALCLRADSALYRDVSNAGPFEFRFFELGTPADNRARELSKFAPHVLVAPSHVIADLGQRAESGAFSVTGLQRLYYGAEPMGDAEREWLTSAFGVRPDPIYQATEGFLGAACRHGSLHLNEDSLIIERSPAPGNGRFHPIITDLRRTSQPVVRVQLDDLLQPLSAPCSCGSPLLAVRGVEGRLADLWRWSGAIIPPRDVEAALSAALGPRADWQATGSATGVRLEAGPEDAPHGATAIAALLESRGVSKPAVTGPMKPMEGFKRRRVRWSDG